MKTWQIITCLERIIKIYEGKFEEACIYNNSVTVNKISSFLDALREANKIVREYERKQEKDGKNDL